MGETKQGPIEVTTPTQTQFNPEVPEEFMERAVELLHQYDPSNDRATIKRRAPVLVQAIAHGMQVVRQAVVEERASDAALRREASNYAEALDNVREAMGLQTTHYLVLPDDVEELVKAVERQGGAALDVLRKLQKRAREVGT